MDAEKPIFIPLCEKPYREFEAGTKQNMEEYRPEGPRWNAKKCRIGRKVVLSLGYGKKHRKTGRIVGYRTASVAEIPQWSTYYGTHPGPVAAIKIELDQP